MTTTIKKWGNSAGLRISKNVLLEMGLNIESKVQIRVTKGKMIISRKNSLPTLDELCAKITPQNRHPETNWGAPIGKEIW